MSTEDLTFRISTLGCRVNHAESREMACVLLDRGLREARPDEQPHLAVVHTCSVTAQAGSRSRRTASRAVRQGAQVTFITGCYATTHTSKLRETLDAQATRIVAHSGPEGDLIDRFTAEVDRWLGVAQGRSGAHSNAPIRRLRSTSSPDTPLPLLSTWPRPDASGHLRAELRIQDGCDAHCTFCILPSIRSTIRSKSIRDAVEEARRLVESGHPEVVLTGIFLGAFGHETALRRRQANPHRDHLADIVERIAQVPGLQRLRLSSLEPGDVTGPMLDAMVANRSVVVPHLHLPLQSGSDAILRRMNRQYRTAEYLDMIDMVNDALSVDGLRPALTTDVICGFPGETDEDFERTVEVAGRVGYLHMHVFPFSPRAGTAAARWRDAFVPDHVKKRRVRTLIDLENDPRDGLSIRYRRGLLGRSVRVLVERVSRSEPPEATGRCDHYVEMTLDSAAPRGSIVRAVVTEAGSAHTIAHVVDESISLPVLV